MSDGTFIMDYIMIMKWPIQTYADKRLFETFGDSLRNEVRETRSHESELGD